MKRRTRVRWLADMLTYTLAMAGMFARDLTTTRLVVTLLVAVLTAATILTGFRPSFGVTLIAFVLGYFVRYAFLFWSFTPHGLARLLRRRFGAQRGFELYEAATALQFFYRGVTFSWLIAASKMAVPARWEVVLGAVGLALAALGTIVNLAATDVIGLRSYFYGDLFDGPSAKPDFKAEGPYRYLANPMYGVGQCAGYGAALMALSPLGVLATLVNQLTMYVFTALVETPHVQEVLRRSPAPRRAPAGALARSAA